MTTPPATRPGWRAARVALVIALASVAVRIVCFLQLNATPLVELHRLEATDMHFYEGWGRRIAGGDWLSATVAVPPSVPLPGLVPIATVTFAV